ncbi:MAG: ferritin-like domain-containing protein [Nitrospirota bacterium]|nr:ferritin-like domain-containing protein [Nitrospirota bacterium]
MLVRSDEKVPIARLLTFLEHGERMAHDCARAQAVLVPDAGARRFLFSQARQEAAHALVFQGAIAWLAPKHLGDTPFLPALEAYRTLLDDALARQDVLETVLAEQVILEGLGEAILTRIEAGLTKRAAPFGRLRRILLQQEEAHHGFGRRMLERAMAEDRIDAETLCRRAETYLALTDQMVLTLSHLFESIAEDPTVWAQDVRGFLPEWLTQAPMADGR